MGEAVARSAVVPEKEVVGDRGSDVDEVDSVSELRKLLEQLRQHPLLQPVLDRLVLFVTVHAALVLEGLDMLVARRRNHQRSLLPRVAQPVRRVLCGGEGDEQPRKRLGRVVTEGGYVCVVVVGREAPEVALGQLQLPGGVLDPDKHGGERDAGCHAGCVQSLQLLVHEMPDMGRHKLLERERRPDGRDDFARKNLHVLDTHPLRGPAVVDEDVRDRRTHHHFAAGLLDDPDHPAWNDLGAAFGVERPAFPVVDKQPLHTKRAGARRLAVVSPDVSEDADELLVGGDGVEEGESGLLEDP
mmetsp:Transcript_44837/g.90013  ORF Transcript_44837/g.90013 Transcript_44837/m.90013 type:complete len:300 (-) Transcript_44837:211-1110(-)